MKTKIPQKIKNIRELLDLMKISQTLLANIKKSVPIELQSVVNEEDFINKIFVVTYDKHFSPQDIKSLMKFYKTKIGQKLLDKAPLILEDIINETKIYSEQVIQKASLQNTDIMKLPPMPFNQDKMQIIVKYAKSKGWYRTIQRNNDESRLE
jgi:hypothetical protein